jgi:hypothetical protein
MKETLMGSYGKTKWQMAYALLDRRPPMMMAEMLGLRFETSAPDSLLLALYLRRLPASIRDHLAAANHETATAIATHADILWDARNAGSVSTVTDSLSAVSLRSSSPRDSRSPDRRTKSPDCRARSPGRRRDHGRGRRPTPGRQNSRAASAGSKVCYYHQRSGAKAVNCEGVCTWTEN